MTDKTIGQLYRETRDRLREVPVEAPEREALMLCEKIFGFCGRAALTVRGDDIASSHAALQLERAAAQRATRPLQYILGQWQFCEMQLAVGEGVLVPREDTVALVDMVCDGLSDMPAPYVLDLCAGTGAVGLAVLRSIPDARCVFVELSDEALPYLRQNIDRYGDGRAHIVCADVTQPPPKAFSHASFDAICSNPPYIPTHDIAGLGREVRQEPSMALDGGSDGLNFYRDICSLWTPLLKPGGQLSVEAGMGQHESVQEIFVRNGLEKIRLGKDYSEIYRVINGTLKSSF